MTLENVISQICSEAGLGENPSQHRDRIIRNLGVVLEEMDALVAWRCAIDHFTKTIPVNTNKVAVPNVNLFKPIVCKFVDSDSVEHVLDYRERTDFEIEDAEYGTDTNDTPTIYTIGGGYIYVGPGIMAVATTITGETRRPLSVNDVPELPAPMMIDGTVKRIAKKGSPEAISAWNGWNLSKKAIITAASKHTGEERDHRPLDPVIARNIAYLSTL